MRFSYFGERIHTICQIIINEFLGGLSTDDKVQIFFVGKDVGLVLMS